MNKIPRAELITHTMLPLETIYCLWHKSKDKNFNMTPQDVKQLSNLDAQFAADVLELFQKVIRQDIPVSENIDFVFMIYDDPIAHREQMVRHRIGVNYGDNFGVDIIPDQQKSSFWSQSMRIMDYSKFVDDQLFFTPESVIETNGADEVYAKTMLDIQDGYKKLVELGVPFEDARGLLPLHSTMDISWKINMTALMKIVGKRSCWILQYGLWGNIINSMISELCEKIHPVFREIVLPPCFANSQFSECKFKHENERRVDGRDVLPVCPLYYNHHMLVDDKYDYSKNTDANILKIMNRLAEKYQELWKRDVYTGEKI